MKQSSADKRQSLGITTSVTNNYSGNKSVTFTLYYRYYDSNYCYELSNNDKYKVLKARSNRTLGKKSTKLGRQSNLGVGSNNGHGKWKSKIAMIEKKFRNHKRQMSVFNTAAKPGLDYEELDGLAKEDGNRKHSALTRPIKYKHYKKA